MTKQYIRSVQYIDDLAGDDAENEYNINKKQRVNQYYTNSQNAGWDELFQGNKKFTGYKICLPYWKLFQIKKGFNQNERVSNKIFVKNLNFKFHIWMDTNNVLTNLDAYTKNSTIDLTNTRMRLMDERVRVLQVYNKIYNKYIPADLTNNGWGQSGFWYWTDNNYFLEGIQQPWDIPFNTYANEPILQPIKPNLYRVRKDYITSMNSQHFRNLVVVEDTFDLNFEYTYNIDNPVYSIHLPNIPEINEQIPYTWIVLQSNFVGDTSKMGYRFEFFSELTFDSI